MAKARGQGKAGAHKDSPARAAALIGGAALLVLVGAKTAAFLSHPPGHSAKGTPRDWLKRWVEVTPAPKAKDPAATALVAALEPLGVRGSEIRRESLPEIGSGRRQAERWRVPLPARISAVAANLAVTWAAPGMGLQVIDAWEEGADPTLPALTMVLGRTREASYRIEFVRSEGTAGGAIAVIIDDFGLEWDGTAEAWLRFPAPLTVGVLPGYRNSRQVADAARRRGFELLLHLPMEPERYPQMKPGPEAILVDQTAAEMRATLRRALRSVGKVAGISSHMGSRATTDRDLMRTVLDESRRQGLFFVDTRTTPESVAAEVAREVGAPYLVNRLFLDERQESKAIAERLAEAVAIAEKDGEVAVVAHGYPETLGVLEEALPKLKARGLKLVTASELVRTTAPEPL